MATSLKDLQDETERLWAIALAARQKAAAAERIWRAALKESYGKTQLEVVGVRGCEE